jgi:hypothetical protein
VAKARSVRFTSFVGADKAGVSSPAPSTTGVVSRAAMAAAAAAAAAVSAAAGGENAKNALNVAPVAAPAAAAVLKPSLKLKEKSAGASIAGSSKISAPPPVTSALGYVSEQKCTVYSIGVSGTHIGCAGSIRA